MSSIHGRPTAGELLAATREFLRDQVLAKAEPSEAFHLRVAINTLAICERELAGGDQPVPAWKRLGLADETALATSIRTGALRTREVPELAALLMPDVETRLRVANPQFLNDFRPDEE